MQFGMLWLICMWKFSVNKFQLALEIFQAGSTCCYFLANGNVLVIFIFRCDWVCCHPADAPLLASIVILFSIASVWWKLVAASTLTSRVQCWMSHSLSVAFIIITSNCISPFRVSTFDSRASPTRRPWSPGRYIVSYNWLARSDIAIDNTDGLLLLVSNNRCVLLRGKQNKIYPTATIRSDGQQ